MSSSSKYWAQVIRNGRIMEADRLGLTGDEREVFIGPDEVQKTPPVVEARDNDSPEAEFMKALERHMYGNTYDHFESGGRHIDPNRTPEDDFNDLLRRNGITD